MATQKKKQEKKDDAIVKAEKKGQLSKTIEDLHLMSQAVYKSGYFPEIKSAAQGFLRMKVGMELGLPEMAALRAVHYLERNRDFVIETNALAAMAVEQGIRWEKLTPREERKIGCKLRIYKPGSDIPEVIVEFTEEDAKQADLLRKDNWKMYPERMYFKRALKFGLNEFDPRLDMGYYTREELEDVEPFKDDDEEEEIQEAEIVEEEKSEREPGEDDDLPLADPEEPTTPGGRAQVFDDHIKVIEADCEGRGLGIYQDFKQYLFDKQIDKTFVGKNVHQNLSLHCGKSEDVAFLYKERIKFYDWYFQDREKMAMSGKPVPPACLRYFKPQKHED